MDHTGVTPQVAVLAPDLAAKIARPGPFLSVYLTTEPEVENAAQRSELRWKSLRAELAGQGTPEGALAAVDPLVPDAHRLGATLAVIATADGLLHAANEPEPPARDVGLWAPLPVVGPLLEWRQSQPTHVVALVDRQGGDLFVFRHGPGPDEHVEAAADPDLPVHKAKPGGWSQRRYQQRAENAWKANETEVAAELSNLVKAEEPRLVLVGGDVRAVQLLKEALSAEVLGLVRDISGARSPDGSIDHVAEEVTRLVATAVAEDTRQLLAKFKEERGQDDRAADGVAATMAALNRSQVEALLVHDDPDDAREAWFGPDPVPVGLDPVSLRDLGVADPQRGRLVDVALRAAVGTGAGVRMIPGAGGPAEGLGAVLRWS